MSATLSRSTGQRSLHLTRTHEMSQRLLAMRDEQARAAGERLRFCPTNEDGIPCRHPMCPRCRARTARKNRRGLEVVIREVGDDAQYALFTGTAPSNFVEAGRRNLLSTFAEVRRGKAWRSSVVGGIGGIEVIPSTSESWRWHLHAHVFVWCAGGEVDTGSICASWRRRQAGSTAHWLPIAKVWSSGSRTFRSERVLRDEEAFGGLVWLRRRRADRARAERAAKALGSSLRAVAVSDA